MVLMQQRIPIRRLGSVVNNDDDFLRAHNMGAISEHTSKHEASHHALSHRNNDAEESRPPALHNWAPENLVSSARGKDSPKNCIKVTELINYRERCPSSEDQNLISISSLLSNNNTQPLMQDYDKHL